MLNGSQRFQAMPKRFAKQGTTHLAYATLVPCRPGGEQVARDPGTAHTGVGGVCILNVRRAVHRGLSFREGVLAQASAVRPRATPRTQKGHTHYTDTEQTTRTHCAVYATTRNRTPSLNHSVTQSLSHSPHTHSRALVSHVHLCRTRSTRTQQCTLTLHVCVRSRRLVLRVPASPSPPAEAFLASSAFHVFPARRYDDLWS